MGYRFENEKELYKQGVKLTEYFTFTFHNPPKPTFKLDNSVGEFGPAFLVA